MLLRTLSQVTRGAKAPKEAVKARSRRVCVAKPRANLARDFARACSPSSIASASSSFRSAPLSPLRASMVRFYSNESLNDEVFDKAQSELVAKEMETLKTLITTLETINASKEDTLELKKSIEQLKDLFLLVIVGEFNSGKSSFLNAMLGKKWLEEGVTPTTAQVNILRNGPEFKVVQRSGMIAGLTNQDEHVEVHVPVAWLKQISLVDTPGTNAVVQGHQEITEHFVPRSDLVLFVTSCDRAFTESERAFLERVKQFNKKVVVVLSKIDALEDPAKDLPQIINFVNDQTKRLFGFVPQTFPVSSKLALKAKTAAAASKDSAQRTIELEHSDEWSRSRFGPLESYILDTLNAKERGKLKLQNPLGIADHFIKKYQLEQETRSAIIKEDVQTLGRIENELEAFRAELMAEYSYHEDRIDSVLFSLSERARNYIEENLVLSNAWKLTKTEVMKEEFEKRVVADTPAQIDAYINDMIDWMLSKQAKQWTRVVEYASQRQQISNLMSGVDPSKNVVGSFKTQYSYNRALLIGNLGGSAKKVVDEFDRRKEAEHLATTVKSAIYQTAAFEIGVVGIVCAYFKGLFPSLRRPPTDTSVSSSSPLPSDLALDSASQTVFIDPVATTSLLDTMLNPIFQGGWLTLSLLDITGLVGVTTMAALGMAWLPYRKRQLISGLNSQISDIRIRLKSSLKNHFDYELQKGLSELKENMSPYANLVQSEQKKLEAAGEKLDEVSKTVTALRREIDVAFA